MEDGQGDGGLPDPTYADESNGREVVYETNGALDQLVASKQSLGSGGGDSPGTLDLNEIPDPFAVEITDLVWI